MMNAKLFCMFTFLKPKRIVLGCLFVLCFCANALWAGGPKTPIDIKWIEKGDGTLDSLPCLNGGAIYMEFQILVQRSAFNGVADKDKKCDENYFAWTFPNMGWSIKDTRNGFKVGDADEYDTVYLNLQTRVRSTTPAAIAGWVTACYMEDVYDPSSDTLGILNHYINILPGNNYGMGAGATRPDTIYIYQGTACQDEEFRFSIPLMMACKSGFFKSDITTPP